MIEPEYVDGVETRDWDLLQGLDRRAALQKYPDFDLAVLRAAYITPSIDDHEMADISLVKEGLQRCVRVSGLLARLSCWHAWNCRYNEFAYGSASLAVQFAVHALLAGPLPTGPGSSAFQAYLLLVELTRYVDRQLSDDLYFGGARGKLAREPGRDVNFATESCVRSFPIVAERATEIAREAILPKVRGG